MADADHLQRVADLADAILADCGTRRALDRLERDCLSDRGATPLPVHVAVKLARSKRIVAGIETSLHVSVLFAVYKEHQRIRSPRAHPHGEAFLARKLAQLAWLFDGNPAITWDMYVVDDGCPEGSGRIAQKLLGESGEAAPVRVLFLEDAIREHLPVVRGLKSAAESQKGGAIVYGLWTAAQEERSRHVLIYTDADLSTHLGQCGLLLDPILHGGKDAAIGSRREPASVVVKQGTRNARGKLFIYLWKRILGTLHHIVDTQCGFKAFDAATVRAIVDDLIERRFAFDIELLLKTELRHPQSIANVPIAWIDSEAASTTRNLQPYHAMLQAMVRMYRHYLPATAPADAFAAFIDALDETGWNRLVANIPAGILDREPASFAEFDAVSVADLHAALA